MAGAPDRRGNVQDQNRAPSGRGKAGGRRRGSVWGRALGGKGKAKVREGGVTCGTGLPVGGVRQRREKVGRHLGQVSR